MADKNLTAKDMSMVFEETCLTVKDVKKWGQSCIC